MGIPAPTAAALPDACVPVPWRELRPSASIGQFGGGVWGWGFCCGWPASSCFVDVSALTSDFVSALVFGRPWLQGAAHALAGTACLDSLQSLGSKGLEVWVLGHGGVRRATVGPRAPCLRLRLLPWGLRWGGG